MSIRIGQKPGRNKEFFLDSSQGEHDSLYILIFDF
jgi:hypothetical protein